eukprot:5453730-Karenia_brevis.AAC.1
MLSVGIAPHIAAALLQELVEVYADAEVHGVARVQNIRVNKGGRQGGTETPNMWNWLLEHVLKSLVETWNRSGYGFQYESGPLINH